MLAFVGMTCSISLIVLAFIRSTQKSHPLGKKVIYIVFFQNIFLKKGFFFSKYFKLSRNFSFQKNFHKSFLYIWNQKHVWLVEIKKDSFFKKKNRKY